MWYIYIYIVRHLWTLRYFDGWLCCNICHKLYEAFAPLLSSHFCRYCAKFVSLTRLLFLRSQITLWIGEFSFIHKLDCNCSTRSWSGDPNSKELNLEDSVASPTKSRCVRAVLGSPSSGLSDNTLRPSINIQLTFRSLWSPYESEHSCIILTDSARVLTGNAAWAESEASSRLLRIAISTKFVGSLEIMSRLS